MRKHATSWMIKFLLSAIVIVFVFWGVGSFRDQQPNQVAEVNGVSISIDDYYSAYNNLIERYKSQFGDNLNEKMLELLNIKKQAIDSLIDRAIVIQEAQKLNITVTNKELIDSIQNISYFKKDGIFDNRLYRNMLKYSRLSPEQFEENHRQSLLIDKLERLIGGSAKVSEPEIKMWYDYQNEATCIDYVAFEFKSYTDIEITKEDIESYYNDNKDVYMTELQLKANYVVFKHNANKHKVIIEDDHIQDYYEIHKQDEFTEPKTVEARHILLKLDKEANEEQVEIVRKKAEAIEKEAKSGKNFAELAQQYSEGPSKEDGGYLGSFKQEDMVKPFSDKAFSMKAGDISEPVLTQFGWHIIKVEAVNEAKEITIGEATPDIREKLIAEASKNMAFDEAEKFSEMLYDGDNLSSIAQSVNISVNTTTEFTRSGPWEIGQGRYAFATAAFELNVNDISSIVETDDAYYIIQVIEKKEPEVQPLVVVEERVKNDLLTRRQKNKAFENSVSLLNLLKEEQKQAKENQAYTPSMLISSSDGQTYSLSKTDYFKRNEQISGIGYEKDISQAAFELSEANPIHYTVIEGRKGYFVIRFHDKKVPNEETYLLEKSESQKTLLDQKRSRIFQDWIDGIKSKSNIKIEPRFQDTQQS